MSLNDFQSVELLEPEKTASSILGVDFNDTTQGVKLEILWEMDVEPKKQTVTINAPLGELIRAVAMSESLFLNKQGKMFPDLKNIRLIEYRV